MDDREMVISILSKINESMDFIVVGSAGIVLYNMPTLIRDIDILVNVEPEGFNYAGEILYGNDLVKYYGNLIDGIVVDVALSKKQYEMLYDKSRIIDGIRVAHPTHILLAKLSKLAMQISIPKSQGGWFSAPKNVMDILTIYSREGLDLQLAEQYIEELNLADVLNVLRFGEIALEVQLGMVLASYPLKVRKVDNTVPVWAKLKSELFYVIDKILERRNNDEGDCNQSS